MSKQPLRDHEVARLDEHEADQRARRVVVDRLEDGLAQRQQLEVLLHHLDLVAVQVQHRDQDARALGPGVAVLAPIFTQRIGPSRRPGTWRRRTRPLHQGTVIVLHQVGDRLADATPAEPLDYESHG